VRILKPSRPDFYNMGYHAGILSMSCLDDAVVESGEQQRTG
jgi:hypothetical protein